MADETTATVEAPTQAPAQNEIIDPTKVEIQVPSATDKKAFDEGMKIFGEVFTGKFGKKKPSEPEKPAQSDKAKEEDKGAKKEEKQEDTVKTTDEKLTEDGAPAQHKPKTKPKAQPRPAIDETRIAEIAAEAGARASTETITRMEAEKSKVDKSVAESFKPPAEYVDQFETFKVLAKLNPDKYANIVDEFKKFTREEESYIADWKRSNPGQKWDSEADEHNDFYERATPAYDEKDFRRAEIRREWAETKKEIRQEVLDEVQPKLHELDELKRTETIRSLEPQVAVAARSAMGAILKAIDPAYEKFVPPEELPKLRDENPMAFDIALEVGRDALPFVSEVTRLFKSNGAIKAEEKNPLHHYIYTYAAKMMELIKALPADEQLRDGKKFATWDEFSKLSAAKQESYWTIGEQDLIDRKLLDAKEIAKERFGIEEKKLEKWAKHKGLAVSNANKTLPKSGSPESKTDETPVIPRDTNGSPSVGSRTQVGVETTPTPGARPSYLDQFGAIMSGRKL